MVSADDLELSGVHPSSNIQEHPDVYELENRAADQEFRLEAAMRSIQPWDGRVVVDVGAGTGFHVPRFATTATHVIAVEPNAGSRLACTERCARLRLANVTVVSGSAERLPLPDASADIVHARFAYFFGPGCEAGLAEAQRVLRPGGVVFVIDNDRSHGTFAAWLRRSPWAPTGDAAAVEEFWAQQGFRLLRVPSEWRFRSRHDLEAVLAIEFPPNLAEELMLEHPGTVVDYHYAVYWRRVG